MQRVATVESLEAIVGTPSPMVLLKAITRLDEGCRKVLADSSLAAFGFRSREGVPSTTFVGGVRGFARMDSASRLTFDLDPNQHTPFKGGGVSLLFLLLGVGETLRVNGSVVKISGSAISVEVEEAFVHCARCILRSGLWKQPKTDSLRSVCDSVGASGNLMRESSGPLSEPSIAEFVELSTFIAESSWDANGFGDTSPKGDPAGFMKILDGYTLAIPDRKGNRRADTFHNILTCEQISLVALVNGYDTALHISGTAYITDDRALLSAMALTEKLPLVALIVHVEYARIVANTALRESKLWDTSVHLDLNTSPDLNLVATRHMSSTKASGRRVRTIGACAEALGRIFPGLMRKLMNFAYRKALKDEGY